MNLRSVYLLCIKNKTALKNLKATSITISNRVGKRVEGWAECCSAIEELKNVEALKDECLDLLKAVPSFFRSMDTFDILESEWVKISDERNYLYRTVIDIVDLCEKMGISESGECGLDIKLPHYSDFTEFVKYVNDINFIFSKCPFLSCDDEKLEFRNVDVGSTWLTFAITGAVVIGGTSVLLNNIAAFIDKCIVVLSHYLSTEKQKVDLEKQERSESEKEVILKYIENLYANEVETAIAELEKSTGYTVENQDGDERMRIIQCIERMGNLIEKGLQIYAAIDSSEENKVLFQPLEMKYIEYQKNLKLLESKDEEVVDS